MAVDVAHLIHEMLDSIFQCLRDSDPKVASKPHPRQLKRELRSASLVCKRWKDVIQAPHLSYVMTCHFGIQHTEFKTGILVPSIETYAMWISDSKNCDIDIQITGCDQNSVGVFEPVPFDYIGLFSRQWRALVAICLDDEIYAPVLHLLESASPIPRLQYLEIDCACKTEEAEEEAGQVWSLPKLATDFYAPGLTHLKLKNADFTNSWPSTTVFDRLQCFEYSLGEHSTYPTPTILSQLLQPAVHLTHLKLFFEVSVEMSHDVEVWYSAHLAKLPLLQTLGLMLDSHYVVGLLGQLELPNLHSLSLNLCATVQVSTMAGEDIPYPNVIISLKRLRYLRILAVDCIQAMRFVALLECPALQELHMTTRTKGINLLNLPQLEFPSLETCFINGDEEQILTILQHIELPCLKRLGITEVKHSGEEQNAFNWNDRIIRIPSVEVFEFSMQIVDRNQVIFDNHNVAQNEIANLIGNFYVDANGDVHPLETPVSQDPITTAPLPCDLLGVLGQLLTDVPALSLSFSSKNGWDSISQGLGKGYMRNLQVLRIDADIPPHERYSETFEPFDFQALWTPKQNENQDQDAEHEAATPKSEIPFPNLKLLQVIFPRGRSETMFMQVLRDLVVMRATMGAPLEKLEIYPPSSNYYRNWMTKHVHHFVEYADPGEMPSTGPISMAG